jgi:hypothetical protein
MSPFALATQAWIKAASPPCANANVVAAAATTSPAPKVPSSRDFLIVVSLHGTPFV